MKSPRPDVVVTKLVVSRLVVCGSVVVRTVVVAIIVVGGYVVGMTGVVVMEIIVGLVEDINFVDTDVDVIFVVESAAVRLVDFTVVGFIVLYSKVVVRLGIAFDCCVGFGIGFIFFSNVLTMVVATVIELVGVVIVVLVSGNKLFSKFIVGLSISESFLGIITEADSDIGIAVVDAIVAFLVVGEISAGRASIVEDSTIFEFTKDSVIAPVVFGTVSVEIRVACVTKVVGFVVAVVRLVAAFVVFTVVGFVVAIWVVTVVVIGLSAAVVIIKASSSSSKVFGVVN